MKNVAATLLGLALMACSSSEDHDAGHGDQDTGHAGHDTGVDAGAPSDAAIEDRGPSDVGTVVVLPPTLTVARLVMHGEMRLDWTLPAAGCDSIEILRKKDAGAYQRASLVTGVAVSATDMPGHDNGTYCYQLICTLGGEASQPSNEMCVTQ